MPPVNLKSAWTIVLSGSVATIVFDFFGQSFTPMLGLPGLAPVPLANAVIESVFGAPYPPGANLLHYLAGIVAYPVGWMFIAEPLSRRLTPGLPWWGAAAAYGVGLWIFALYVLAHLVAGSPAFLGFVGITWVALVGHILFALVAAAIIRWRDVGVTEVMSPQLA